MPRINIGRFLPRLFKKSFWKTTGKVWLKGVGKGILTSVKELGKGVLMGIPNMLFGNTSEDKRSLKGLYNNIKESTTEKVKSKLRLLKLKKDKSSVDSDITLQTNVVRNLEGTRSKAELRYNKLQSELESLNKRRYKNQEDITKLTDSIKFKQLTIERENIKTKIEQLKDENAKLELQYNEKKLESDDLVQKLHELDSKIKEGNFKIVKLSEKVDSIDSKISEEPDSKGSLKGSLRNIDDKITNLLSSMMTIPFMFQAFAGGLANLFSAGDDENEDENKDDEDKSEDDAENEDEEDEGYNFHFQGNTSSYSGSSYSFSPINFPSGNFRLGIPAGRNLSRFTQNQSMQIGMATTKSFESVQPIKSVKITENKEVNVDEVRKAIIQNGMSLDSTAYKMGANIPGSYLDCSRFVGQSIDMIDGFKGVDGQNKWYITTSGMQGLPSLIKAPNDVEGLRSHLNQYRPGDVMLRGGHTMIFLDKKDGVITYLDSSSDKDPVNGSDGVGIRSVHENKILQGKYRYIGRIPVEAIIRSNGYTPVSSSDTYEFERDTWNPTQGKVVSTKSASQYVLKPEYQDKSVPKVDAKKGKDLMSSGISERLSGVTKTINNATNMVAASALYNYQRSRMSQDLTIHDQPQVNIKPNKNKRM